MSMLVNPHQYLYKQVMTGRNVDVLRFDGMVRRFYDVERLKLIDDMCKVSGKIAIAGNCLTRSQRSKYEQQRIKSGRNSFYLFEKSYVPADVGGRVDLDPDTRVYTDLNDMEVG